MPSEQIASRRILEQLQSIVFGTVADYYFVLLTGIAVSRGIGRVHHHIRMQAYCQVYD